MGQLSAGWRVPGVDFLLGRMDMRIPGHTLQPGTRVSLQCGSAWTVRTLVSVVMNPVCIQVAHRTLWRFVTSRIETTLQHNTAFRTSLHRLSGLAT
ncbi:hypothetical protein BH24CHL1_BH24CHL1_11380 [soil metagenome]